MAHEVSDTARHGTLPVGKLDLKLLPGLLGFHGWSDERVVLGPRIGEDAAVIDFGDRYLVAKSDPITFATEEIGWYLVQVNANDLATTGAMPCWLLVTLLLPEGKATPDMPYSIMRQIDAACRNLHIAIIGGHTEVTHGLDRPIVVGHMLGEVAKDRLVTSGGARVGDDLLLVKGIAIEGTAIIAREMGEELRQLGYAEELIDRARNCLYAPGISILREATLAFESGTVHAMHDPTEGGVATALHELAVAANVGMWIDQDAIPVLPECAVLCAAFGLNPIGLIASGALLVAVPPGQTCTLLAAYERAGVTCAVIGHATAACEGLRLKSGAVTIDLPRFDQDEITRLL